MEYFQFKGLRIDDIVSFDLKSRNETNSIVINSEVVLISVTLFASEHDFPKKETVCRWEISESEIEHVVRTRVVKEKVLGCFINE